MVDDDALRNTISKGRQGTAMSAFAQSEGGMLTDKQVDAIIQGMRQRWGQPQILQGVTAPPYAAKAPGNPAARSSGVRNILRLVSRRRRQGHGQGRLHRESLLSQPDHRSGTCGPS